MNKHSTIRMQIETTDKILTVIKNSFYSLGNFLKILVLGLVAALLLVLPWHLRVAVLDIYRMSESAFPKGGDRSSFQRVTRQ